MAQERGFGRDTDGAKQHADLERTAAARADRGRTFGTRGTFVEADLQVRLYKCVNDGCLFPGSRPAN